MALVPSFSFCYNNKAFAQVPINTGLQSRCLRAQLQTSELSLYFCLAAAFFFASFSAFLAAFSASIAANLACSFSSAILSK